ncbi:MAG: peptide deformylase [Dehalococcoidia bacterium]|nr:peptide deformylase [Dehalococcoidia bacterium]
MSALKIHLVPDPVLRRKANRVAAIDRSVKRLAQEMLETMHEAGGVGLAAPQVGVPLRLVVIEVPDQEPLMLVNPLVVKRSGQREIEEGCLSIPGYRGLVTRSLDVLVKAHDLAAKDVRIRAQAEQPEQALLAQALEHEIDHLNGVLFIDHIHDQSKLYKIEDSPQHARAHQGVRIQQAAGL